MPTPLQIVKEKYGSKDKLVAAVIKLIEPDTDESADEHKARLRLAANRKLLHLHALGEKVKALGGRDGIVKKILEARGQTKDHEYADSLKKRYSLGRLVDLLASAQRRAAGKTKRPPKSQRKRPA